MNPYPTFHRLATRTWLYTPPAEDRIAGQLIVICTWLGAAPKHIGKHIGVHKTIAPGARILLVESEVSILVSSYARQRRLIGPAVDVVRDTLAECQDGDGDDDKLPLPAAEQQRPKIILHTFSNGGTNTLTQLLITLHASLDRPLPVAGLLLDSSPAKGTYWKSYHAMVLSLPPSSRFLGGLVVHCLLVLLYAWIACGNENPASLMRRTLLDDAIVRDPHGDGDAGEGKGRICYLYSKADRMTDWTDVRDHAEEARGKGWRVREVLFDGSGHCAHLARDEDRYVAAVRAMWEMVEESEERKVIKSKL